MFPKAKNYRYCVVCDCTLEDHEYKVCNFCLYNDGYPDGEEECLEDDE